MTDSCPNCGRVGKHDPLTSQAKDCFDALQNPDIGEQEAK